MPATVPPRRDGETIRAYYRRLNTLRASLRGYLPELRRDAVQAGKDAGLTMDTIASRMGSSVAWLYTDRAVSSDYAPELLPDKREDEDDLAYYVRLRELRDALRDELPALVAPAVAEAEQETPKLKKTEVAVEMGVSEGYLFKQLRKPES